jgi:hypothetical protein
MNALRRWLGSVFGSKPQQQPDDRRTGAERRTGVDRRSSLRVPPVSEERRSGADRRSGQDRRQG